MPVAVSSTQFTSEMLGDCIGQDLAPVRELTAIRDVDYVDLPMDH